MLTLLALLVGAFFIIRVWLAGQPDRLAARRRGLSLLIGLLGVGSLVALVFYFTLPKLAPSRSLCASLVLMLFFAIWQRRRLLRQN